VHNRAGFFTAMRDTKSFPFLTNVQIAASCVAVTPQAEAIRGAAAPIRDCIVAV
jgi:hypothetical protein